MFLWISSVILLIGLAASQRSAGAADPPVPDDIVVYHNLSYREGASRHWKLDLAMKKDLRASRGPASWSSTAADGSKGINPASPRGSMASPATSWTSPSLGFVAVTINYRLAGEAPFPAALDDCKTAVRWLRAHAKDYNLDPDHIGAYGNSAGGHLAMLLGMAGNGRDTREGDGPYQDQSSLVQAVVSDSGPIDLIDQHRRGALRQVCEALHGRSAGRRTASPRTGRASPSDQIRSTSTPAAS